MRALRMGYRLIDTAQAYENEALLPFVGKMLISQRLSRHVSAPDMTRNDKGANLC